MNKQNRGDMPAAPAVTFKDYHPLNDKKEQGGFEQDNIRSGNLRDHNGHRQSEGTAETKHYDGDYGDSAGAGAKQPTAAALGAAGSSLGSMSGAGSALGAARGAMSGAGGPAPSGGGSPSSSAGRRAMRGTRR